MEDIIGTFALIILVGICCLGSVAVRVLVVAGVRWWRALGKRNA